MSLTEVLVVSYPLCQNWNKEKEIVSWNKVWVGERAEKKHHIQAYNLIHTSL